MRLSARKCGTQSQKACQSINEPSTGFHRDNYNDNDNDNDEDDEQGKGYSWKVSLVDTP